MQLSCAFYSAELISPFVEPTPGAYMADRCTSRETYPANTSIGRIRTQYLGGLQQRALITGPPERPKFSCV